MKCTSIKLIFNENKFTTVINFHITLPSSYENMQWGIEQSTKKESQTQQRQKAQWPKAMGLLMAEM